MTNLKKAPWVIVTCLSSFSGQGFHQKFCGFLADLTPAQCFSMTFVQMARNVEFQLLPIFSVPTPHI